MKPENFWPNARKRMGFMRQSDLARAIHVKPQQLSRWQRRNIIPRGDVAAAIARTLGSSVEELLSAEVQQ
jgi:transcriptional regulator with XRE-family HTH domain